VDLSANHNTALAIANLSDKPVDISIQAFQTDGTTLVGIGHDLLQPNGHDGKFADTLISGLKPPFAGVLDIYSTTPFAALTMRTLQNERNEFLFCTFPIAYVDRAAPSPIVFPELVAGDGYVTQFILLSAAGASSVTLNFYAEDGTALPVGK
jgi:hypothetical protein